jgi:hypothetical protein
MRPTLFGLTAALAALFAFQSPSAPLTLTGNVRNGGHPVQAYIYAVALPAPSSPPPSTISRPDGTYTLSNLLPGRYRIVASVYPEEIPYRDPEALKPWLLRGRPLTLYPSTTPTLDLQVEPYD